MATILQFRRTTPPVLRGLEADDRVLGQVIIFPGVRIDRWTEQGRPDGDESSLRRRPQRARKKQGRP